MYRCLTCDKTFDDFKIVRGDYHSETTPPSYEPDIAVCPYCGDYEIELNGGMNNG